MGLTSLPRDENLSIFIFIAKEENIVNVGYYSTLQF